MKITISKKHAKMLRHLLFSEPSFDHTENWNEMFDTVIKEIDRKLKD